MAYTVSLSNRFKKDFRRCIKRGLNMKHITDAMDLRALSRICASMRPTSRSLHVGMPTDDVDVEKEYQLIPIDSL